MTAITHPAQCYLAEWYRSGLSDVAVTAIIGALEVAVDALKATAASVQLIVTMAVPADEVLYALFEASSSDLVSEVCLRAGLPPQRLTSDIGAWINVAS